MSYEWKGDCETCKAPGHYVRTDDLGYYHFFCDEHDPRELFQENRKLRAALESLVRDVNIWPTHESLEKQLDYAAFIVKPAREILKRHSRGSGE